MILFYIIYLSIIIKRRAVVMTELKNGFLKKAFDKCLESFEKSIDPEVHKKAYIGDHREYHHFAESEFAGKYLDTCMNFYDLTHDESLLKKADGLVDCIIENQHADGYLGGYPKEDEWQKFSVWNQTFTVYGLLSYYKTTRRKAALNAAEKCAKNIAAHYLSEKDNIMDAFNDGTQNASFLLTLPGLYDVTDDVIYAEFTKYILRRLKTSGNNFFDFESIFDLRSKKGIENFIILIGMLFYYDSSKDSECIKGAEKYWDELKKTQIRRPGNGTNAEKWIPEGNTPCFLPLDIHPNETCVSVGWAEFSLLLYKATGDIKYIDAAERSLFNHIMGSFDDKNADFAYYQPNFGKRVTRTSGQDPYKCCRYRGYNFISRLPELLFTEDENTVIPAIYAPAVWESNGVRIEEKTEYPFDGKISFFVTGASEKSLKLRIPSWCKKYSINVNGKESFAPESGGYVTLGIKDGDEVTLCLDMQIEKEDVNIDGKKYAGFSFGPLVMVPDSDINSDIYGAKDCGGKFVRNKDTKHNIEFDSGDLSLSDYASAAKMNPDDEYTEWILCK